jgi:hypothetical protein
MSWRHRGTHLGIGLFLHRLYLPLFHLFDIRHLERLLNIFSLTASVAP